MYLAIVSAFLTRSPFNSLHSRNLPQRARDNFPRSSFPYVISRFPFTHTREPHGQEYARNARTAEHVTRVCLRRADILANLEKRARLRIPGVSRRRRRDDVESIVIGCFDSIAQAVCCVSIRLAMHAVHTRIKAIERRNNRRR